LQGDTRDEVHVSPKGKAEPPRRGCVMKMLRYDEVFGNGHPVMIKLGNKLRLSARELGAFRKMTGVYPAPATVDEHNGALERAASAWKDKDGSPASQLLQAVLLAERIPKE